MFKFIQTTGISSDCTSGYKIILDKEYTVKSFIETVLKERPKEWGYISISTKGSLFGNPSCEYRYGEIISKPLDNIFLNKKVVDVTASGGWSSMNYIMKLT